jgi:hypothetical protein
VSAPNTPAEARTGQPDRVAAALTELGDLKRRFSSLDHGDGTRIVHYISRIEAILRGET